MAHFCFLSMFTRCVIQESAARVSELACMLKFLSFLLLAVICIWMCLCWCVCVPECFFFVCNHDAFLWRIFNNTNNYIQYDVVLVMRSTCHKPNDVHVLCAAASVAERVILNRITWTAHTRRGCQQRNLRKRHSIEHKLNNMISLRQLALGSYRYQSCRFSGHFIAGNPLARTHKRTYCTDTPNIFMRLSSTQMLGS